MFMCNSDTRTMHFISNNCTCLGVSVLHFLFSVHVHVDEPTKKKRRSRWASEDTRTVIPGLPTVLPSNLSEPQQKLYLCKLSSVNRWFQFLF